MHGLRRRGRYAKLASGAMLVALASLPVSAAAHADTDDYPGLGGRLPAGQGERVVQVEVDETKRFKLSYHEQLSAMVDAECTTMVDRAHWTQDIFLQWDSSLHFDNCAFDEGVAFVDGMAEVIREKGKKAGTDASARRQALYALGRALHTIQDFYAHSNYVEIVDRNPNASADAATALAVVPIWTDAGKQTLQSLRDPPGENKLISGTWLIGFPKRCTAPSLSHGALAKDDNGTTSGGHKLKHMSQWKLANGFQAAFFVARNATARFITDVVPPELIQACPGGLAAIVLFKDPRTE